MKKWDPMFKIGMQAVESNLFYLNRYARSGILPVYLNRYAEVKSTCLFK